MTYWGQNFFCTLVLVGFAVFSFSKVSFAVDPESLKVKIYGAWLSKSEYCTKPIKIFGTIDPIDLNFLGNPELGALDNADNDSNGNYKCFILQMAETIRFIPASTNGYCTQGVEYTHRLCSAGQSTIHPETLETANCQDGSITTDTVFIYMSTASTSSTLSGSSAPFLPPTASSLNNGIRLGQAFTVSGAQSGKFVIDAYEKIESNGTTCRLNNPLFTFSAISSQVR